MSQALIESIQAIIVDLPTIRPHKLAMHTMQNQTLVIIRLLCADGIEGVGAVPFGTLPTRNTAPPYAYRFVIDLGALTAQPLQFGVLDGVYGDNGGAYDLSLYQLRAGATGAVPEPESWALMLIGFGGIGAVSRIRARRMQMRSV